jgi:cell division protein FtsB
MDLRRLQRQQREAEAVAYSLALKNQKLRDHLDRLEHDDRYLEKIARERLGMIKPGEIVYRANARPARP